ncbi:hypothetical protein ACFU8Q_20330 [Streptomyces sp. NPDC057543]|uniref:hypothetical protein n=1 Tax=Streptomyces sp. NPDC057543 TaxID=3346163 RepID=UPI0036C18A46
MTVQMPKESAEARAVDTPAFFREAACHHALPSALTGPAAHLMSHQDERHFSVEVSPATPAPHTTGEPTGQQPFAAFAGGNRSRCAGSRVATHSTSCVRENRSARPARNLVFDSDPPTHHRWGASFGTGCLGVVLRCHGLGVVLVEGGFDVVGEPLVPGDGQQVLKGRASVGG